MNAHGGKREQPTCTLNLNKASNFFWHGAHDHVLHVVGIITVPILLLSHMVPAFPHWFSLALEYFSLMDI